MRHFATVIAAGSLLLAASCSTGSRHLVVTNGAPFDRADEMVEVSASVLPLSAGEFRLLDADNCEVPYQLTHDSLLIFPATVRANATAVYTLEAGTPAAVDTLVWGRQFPERKDDMAWENDRSAYRAYGPALQQSGERAFGYDIWTKSVAHPVLEKRFDLDINQGISFHVDHGDGMDVYAVGPTLGGGTAALLTGDGNIIYPYCYDSYEILDNGPLRFTVRLDYAPVTTDRDSAVVEHRVISLDRGSWLNRTAISYSGLSADATVAPGIVVHRQNPGGYILGDGFMAYNDSTENADNDNGIIFVGVVSPQSRSFEYKEMEEPAGDAIGHILAPAAVSNDKPFVYYWGSGWEKGGMPTAEEWQNYLANYLLRLRTPLTVIRN